MRHGGIFDSKKQHTPGPFHRSNGNVVRILFRLQKAKLQKLFVEVLRTLLVLLLHYKMDQQDIETLVPCDTIFFKIILLVTVYEQI